MLTGKPKPCNWHGNPVGSIILYNIIEDLQSNIPMKEIAKSYNISYSYLSDINNGTRLKQDDLIYPIRTRENNDPIFLLYPAIINELKTTNKSMR